MIEAFFIIAFVVFPALFLINNLFVKPFARRLAEKEALAMGWPSLTVCRHALSLPRNRPGDWPEIIRAHGPYKGPADA